MKQLTRYILSIDIQIISTFLRLRLIQHLTELNPQLLVDIAGNVRLGFYY